MLHVGFRDPLVQPRVQPPTLSRHVGLSSGGLPEFARGKRGSFPSMFRTGEKR